MVGDKPVVRLTFPLSASQLHLIKVRSGLLQIKFVHEIFLHGLEILVPSCHFHVVHVHGQEQTLLTMHEQTFLGWCVLPSIFE